MEQYPFVDEPVTEESLSPEARAYYDHKRFPTLWQAMVGAAGMNFFASSVLVILMATVWREEWFRSDFGYSMSNLILSQFILVLAIPLFMMIICRKDMITTARLHHGIDFKQVLFLLLVVVGLFFPFQYLNSYIVAFFETLFGVYEETSPLDTEAINLGQLLFEIVIVAGLPAFCEEFFFRGMVMRAFERISVVAAWLLSSVVFSLMHGNFSQFFYAFFGGLVMGAVTLQTNSFYAGALVHGGMNFLSVIVSYRPINDWLTHLEEQNTLLFESSLVGVGALIGAAGLVLVILYSRKKNKARYGKAFVSDMAYPKMMKPLSGGLKALYIIAWIVFVGYNLLAVILEWNPDFISSVQDILP